MKPKTGSQRKKINKTKYEFFEMTNKIDKLLSRCFTCFCWCNRIPENVYKERKCISHSSEAGKPRWRDQHRNGLFSGPSQGRRQECTSGQELVEPGEPPGHARFPTAVAASAHSREQSTQGIITFTNKSHFLKMFIFN